MRCINYKKFRNKGINRCRKFRKINCIIPRSMIDFLYKSQLLFAVRQFYRIVLAVGVVKVRVTIRNAIHRVGVIKHSDTAVMPNEHQQQYHFEKIICFGWLDSLKKMLLLLYQQQKFWIVRRRQLNHFPDRTTNAPEYDPDFEYRSNL